MAIEKKSEGEPDKEPVVLICCREMATPYVPSKKACCDFCLAIVQVSLRTAAAWDALDAPKKIMCHVCYHDSEEAKRQPPYAMSESIQEAMQLFAKKAQWN